MKCPDCSEELIELTNDKGDVCKLFRCDKCMRFATYERDSGGTMKLICLGAKGRLANGETKPLDIKYVKIVSVYDNEGFGGHYIKDGDEYHRISTNKQMDFVPEFKEEE